MPKPRKKTRPTASDVLKAVEEAKFPLNLAEVCRRLNLGTPAKGTVKRMLRTLVREEKLSEVRSGRYMPARKKKQRQERRPAGASRSSGAEMVRGRLTMHRDGFGFVIPDVPVAGMEGDVFIPPPATRDAMHGDRVKVRLRRRGRGGKVEGEIVEVERRAHATVVGILRLGRDDAVVLPHDDRLSSEVVIPGDGIQPSGKRFQRRELDGAVVNVEITRYAKAGGRAAGRVVEVLGHPGDFGVDVEIVIRKYHLPQKFDRAVEDEAEAADEGSIAEELGRRRDFRQIPIVTIDGADAKDFDDAVRVAGMENGHYMLHVHIADVAHYVRPGSELDREARLRGTSVYFPDRAIPMLPERLSNGLCSLRPGEDRLVMTCLMEIDPQGEVVRHWLGEGVIRSAARMTYTEVNDVLQGDPAAREKYRDLAPEFDRMRELALILNRRREKRGSIDFDLPEPVIEFDDKGRLTGITRSERNIAHRLIEEFMLAANETVARFLTERGVGMLYRVHEKPDARKVLAFEELAATFGYSLGLSAESRRIVSVKERGARGRGRGRAPVEIPERITVTPFHYQRLTQRIAGKPEERILSFLMLRSLKQAVYSEQNQGHFALADPCYTHFTSPIRRYPDLIIHRLLKWTLRKMNAKHEGVWFHEGSFNGGRGREKLGGPLEPAVLKSIGVESSDAERRADEAERELVELKKLEYMRRHLGDEFEGLVINASRYGLKVELMDLFVEGLVPIATLDPAADYRFREPTRSLVPGAHSRTRKAPIYRIGDRVLVRVDRVDPMASQIEFSIVEVIAAASVK